MSRQSQGSLSIVGAIALGVFLVAMVALMLVGGYTFSPALFLAAAVALAVSVFLLWAFHRPVNVKEPQRLSARVRPSEAKRTTAAPSHADADVGSHDAAAAPSGHHADAGAGAQPSASPSPADAPEKEGADASGDPTVGTEPKRLDGPRDGNADDLKRIKGIGPKLEEQLNRMGVYHLDQIASWSASEVAWMDENLVDFRGRVSRDDWVTQARQLSEGGETEFSKRVDDGGVYNDN